MRHIWLEIEYIRENGDSVHSDVCLPEEDAKKMSQSHLDEVLRLANFDKPWSVHSNGICTIHPEKE